MSERRKRWYSPLYVADRANDGFVAIARSLNGAVNAVHRAPALLLKSTQGRSASPAKATELADRRAEIVSLQRRLEQVFATMLDESKGGRIDYSELSRQAEQLKAEIAARRRALKRLEQGQLRDARFVEHEQHGGERADRMASASREQIRAAVTQALKRKASGGSSEQLFFEKAAWDLLDEDQEIRRSAVLLLMKLALPECHGLLCAAVDDPSASVRLAAVNALTRSNAERSRKIFERFIDSDDHHLRLASLRGLAQIEDRGITRVLVRALEDAHPAVRKAAATLLGWREDTSAKRALSLSLRDEDASVRSAAASSLGIVGGPQAVFSLIRALSDSEVSVRRAAHSALETILGEAVEAPLDSPDQLEARVEELVQWWARTRPERSAAAPEPIAPVSDRPAAKSAPKPIPPAPAKVEATEPEPAESEEDLVEAEEIAPDLDDELGLAAVVSDAETSEEPEPAAEEQEEGEEEEEGFEDMFDESLLGGD